MRPNAPQPEGSTPMTVNLTTLVVIELCLLSLLAVLLVRFG